MSSGRLGVACLIVDLDGVVRTWDPSIMTEAEAAHGLQPGTLAAVAFHPDLLGPAIVGQIDDSAWRSATAAHLLERFGVDGHDVVDRWSAANGEVDVAVLDRLREQRLTRQVVLLTNATTRLRRDLDALGLVHEFDKIYSSSELGWAKPAPEIFEAALGDLRLAPHRVAFVDDSAENVAVANSLGLMSHHFTSVEGLTAFLDRLGGLAD